MSASESESRGRWEKRFGEYREKLLQALLLTIPLAIVAKLNDSLSATLFSQPWQAIWFLVPLAIVIWVLRRGLVRGERLCPDRRLLVFLAAYILLFVIAAQANFLDLSRDLTAFGAPASRRWLTPVSWGDWRYRLVPRRPDRDELIVVLLQPAATLEQSRSDLARLIALSAKSGAKGVALDVYFQEASPRIDSLLCRVISTCGIPVLVGYGFQRTHGRIAEIPPPDSLPCLTAERQAHLAGLLDHDLVARLTPMYFRNDRKRPALGLAVARALAGEEKIDAPVDGLLRFVPPVEGPPTATFEQLHLTDSSWRNLLRNRFVLAGEASARDRFQTAYGSEYGIVIHSYVVHSLREGHYIRRQSWWLGLAVIVVCCYWITLWCANGASARRLVALCAGATVIVLATAIVSILIGPYWFDVVYPIIATWVLLALMLGLRRTVAARAARVTVQPTQAAAVG